MKIEIVREERVTESVFPGDTPLSEVMEDVYHDRHVWQRTPVTDASQDRPAPGRKSRVTRQ